ncbi:hypothetical protein MSIMFI_03451 [Mycobacterium simulans]|uniref:hypothetical protein n=1 Tax=Mycobacterium simulans TaxID=627089 RepID=UPI0017496E1D|nr:hypothetical protein [Mycobacterium simulans]SON61932.1 hypothetical protein MSIMFI_03451 [Mycobacterium simulans]
MPRARWLQSAVVVSVFAVVITPATPTAADTSPTAPCDAISPIAIPCVALGKGADAIAAECRRAGIADTSCTIPLAHRVTQAARDAYLRSWVHRTAQFQYRLGNPLPLRDTQWLGTHNSFNSVAESLTVSHVDSNQQLTLTQQLDIDVRSIELDLHYIRRLERLGAQDVTVCHGLGPDKANLGCTTEPTLAKVLSEVATWLNAPDHTDEVILLYLEDQLKDPAAYASVVASLEAGLRRPDGESLIYRPDQTRRAANGCVPVPLDASRDDIRTSNAQVILVSNCVPGWAGDVFDWNNLEVESGSTPNYQPYPACDATYGNAVYASKLVRYYEDSTLFGALSTPLRPPANPAALTPPKVQAMTDCGVNLFGFDQLLPEDGRIQASLWSWAPDEPRAGAGTCTLQGADGRWIAAQCTDAHPAACQSPTGTWTVTPSVPFTGASSACAAAGSNFTLPRTGDQNARLRAVAETAGGVWVRYTTRPEQ